MYVLIMGYAAVISGDMTGESATLNALFVPSGMGRSSSSGFDFAFAEPSAGAVFSLVMVVERFKSTVLPVLNWE
jgi:hypothetical protein